MTLSQYNPPLGHFALNRLQAEPVEALFVQFPNQAHFVWPSKLKIYLPEEVNKCSFPGYDQ